MFNVRTLDTLAEFDVLILNFGVNEETDLPEDYKGGEWTENADSLSDHELLEAPTYSVVVTARYSRQNGQSIAHGISFVSTDEAEALAEFEVSALYVPMKVAAQYDLAEQIEELRAAIALVAVPA